jgi:hypothetical protein
VQSGIDSSDTHYALGLTFVNLGNKKAAQNEYNILRKLSEAESFDVLQKLIEKRASELLEQINKL